MVKQQHIVLVADQEGLLKIYDVAQLANSSDFTSKLNSTANLLTSNFGKKRSFNLKKIESMTKKQVALLAISPINVSVIADLLVDGEETDINLILSIIKKLLGVAIDLEYVPFSKANAMKVGMGLMPKNNCFYVSDLIDSNLYIPLQDYDKYLAKAKNNAFMELAAALGAKRIILEDAYVSNTKGEIGTDFSILKPMAIDIGINASFEKDGSVKRTVHSLFDSPKAKPEISPYLQRWIDADADLRLMVSHRLNHGLRSHRISLSFEDNFSTAVKASAYFLDPKKGFGVKAITDKSMSSTWIFDVEYYPMES